MEHGGDLVAEVLRAHGVEQLFTLSGGHISPILVGAKKRNIKVLDTRHEASAAFAADATSRLTGIPGVAVVTAGPGVTNTITAIQNAKMEEFPFVLIGGAAGTVLKGRRALQDIDMISVVKPIVKWAVSIKKVKHIVPTLRKAFKIAKFDVRGPVFVEIPIDLLYPESLVREMYGITEARTLFGKMFMSYLKYHLHGVFASGFDAIEYGPLDVPVRKCTQSKLQTVKRMLEASVKPVMLISSQAMYHPHHIEELQDAVESLGIPLYLSGHARGLLGRDHEIYIRHERSKALKQADLVLLVGVATDFRLDYGRKINKHAKVISINLGKDTLNLNRLLRSIEVKIHADPGLFLMQLASLNIEKHWDEWLNHLQQLKQKRIGSIHEKANMVMETINPLTLCMQLEQHIDDNSYTVMDGGDFVATFSYIFSPRKPLRWLNPGVFGTLGSGGGYALAARAQADNAEVWIIYGDGSSAYSLAEIDTFVRHNLPVIAVIGNDASWQQIAREQVEILNDDVATKLRYSNYHKAAEGCGAIGMLVEKEEEIVPAILNAKDLYKQGKSVVINVILGKSDFRDGSISV
ncbi:MAG: thiamine pyrophosphate-binding protein [Candidatus Heimdallarchaeota archaeon]|nr:thiamine pyrophosphate-binding protein [Candidatus Heimdallarchaeota archaeon]